MNNADKSVARIHEITRSMQALVPHPLSRPATRMPSAQEILKHEREQDKHQRRDAPEPFHPSDRLVIGGSILACIALAVILVFERFA